VKGRYTRKMATERLQQGSMGINQGVKNYSGCNMANVASWMLHNPNLVAGLWSGDRRHGPNAVEPDSTCVMMNISS
jgi:hypothetical protein